MPKYSRSTRQKNRIIKKSYQQSLERVKQRLAQQSIKNNSPSNLQVNSEKPQYFTVDSASVTEKKHPDTILENYSNGVFDDLIDTSSEESLENTLNDNFNVSCDDMEKINRLFLHNSCESYDMEQRFELDEDCHIKNNDDLIEINGINLKDLYQSDEIEHRYSSDDDCDDVDQLDSRTIIKNDECFISTEFLTNSLKTILPYWAVENNINHAALTRLLKSIRAEVPNLTDLPLDARTLLKTPVNSCDIDVLDNGSYCHYGMKSCLQNIIKGRTLRNDNEKKIQLLINIDGAPLGQSSEKSLWPILCSESKSNDVYIIGVFSGESKPKDPNTYLRKFVDDSIEYVNNGIQVNNKTYEVTIHALICDAPAKAFVLNTKYHSGYDCCSKCKIEGEMYRCVVFPIEDNLALRNDDEFRNNEYIGNYQRATSILNEIPKFGLVTGVPLDCMHLVYLGCVRKLLLLWMFSKCILKLPQIKIDQISSNLIALKKCIPYEFAREPRDLKYIKLYKATEFRQFLLYTGIIVLKDVLEENVYINFITLHVAISCLCNASFIKNQESLDYASQLLEKFVRDYQKLYGKSFVTYNIHNLLHLVEDVSKYGSLENFSAFRFENYLRRIKKMIRKGNQPLSQISKRCAEIERFTDKKELIVEKNVLFLHEHSIGPTLNQDSITRQFTYAQFSNFKLNCHDEKNNCVLLKDGSYIIVKNFVILENKKKIFIGQEMTKLGNFYDAPCESSNLGIYKIKLTNDTQLRSGDVTEIRCKVCRFLYKHEYVVVPLIHTLSSQKS